MNRELIRNNIEIIIKQYNGNNNMIIDNDTILLSQIGENNLGISSLEFVEIIIAIEDFYGIGIDLDKQMDTFGDLVQCVVDEILEIERISDDKKWIYFILK